MSKPSRHDFTCSCGQRFEADVFKSANVTLQPDLKARILTRQFNRVRCPACGSEIDADIPYLYHDMDANLLIWVYPSERAALATAIREKVRRSYDIVGSVLPRVESPTDREVVFGVEELLALIDRKPDAP